MNDIVTLITQTGFPIVACIFMARYFAKTIDNFRQDLAGMKEALNGNTLVLQRVLDKLDMEEPDNSGRKAG